MSTKLGQTLAGLLNATFGNAVEIIVGVAALFQGACLCGLVAPRCQNVSSIRTVAYRADLGRSCIISTLLMATYVRCIDAGVDSVQSSSGLGMLFPRR